MYQNIKTLLQMIRQLLIVLDTRQKKKCAFVFFCILVGSMFEMLGVSVMLPFLQMVMQPEKMQQSWYGNILIHVLHIKGSQNLLVVLALCIVVLYIVKNAVILFSVYEQNRLNSSINRELATLMLRSYMKRPYTFFLEHNSADIIRGVNTDVNGVFNIISNIFKLLAETLTCAAIAVFLLISDTFMAVGVVGLAGICLLAVTFGFKGIMRDMGNKQREAAKYCSKHAYQAINGIKEITVMKRNDNFVTQYDEAADLKRQTNLAYNFIVACPNRIVEAVCIGGIMGVVCFRIVQGVDIQSFVPQLGVFAVAAFKILPSVANISSYISGLVFYRPTLQEAYENIVAAREYEKYRLEYSSKKGITEKTEIDPKTCSFEKEIAINEIVWRYNNSDYNVLDGLSLTIHHGESVALIGASGAGKTTLADIILGLLPPKEGSIQVDGKDIYAIPREWARMIGYVPQSVFLTDDTIRNNVSFGLLPEEIDDDKVWEALEQSQLAEFVRSLPKGIDTIVGERGVKFSGGQRQRVAIARALYYNPEILVLDEATSALDGETESAVMESIETLQGHKTLIIVAHRLTTIKSCDRIYEITGGKAEERSKEEVFGTQE